MSFVMAQLGQTKEKCEYARQALSQHSVVTIADLNQTVLKCGLHTKVIWLPFDKFEAASEEFGSMNKDVGVIALLRRSEDPNDYGHFVVVTSIERDLLHLFDATSLETKNISGARLFKAGVPLLIVSPEPLKNKPFVSDLYGALCDVLASPKVTLTFTALLFLIWMQKSGFRGVIFQLLSVRKMNQSLNEMFLNKCSWAVLRRTFWVIGIAMGTVLIYYSIYSQVHPIAVSEKTIHLGRCPLGSVRASKLAVTNKSFLSPVRIETPRTSCSCISAQVHAEEIPAMGQIDCTVQTQILRPGFNAYSILLFSPQDSKQHVIEVSYEGFESARLSPSQINIGCLPFMHIHNIDRLVRLQSYSGSVRQVRVSDASRLPTGVRASVNIENADDADSPLIALRLQSDGSLQIGRFSSQIMIEVDNDPLRTFVLTVYGEVVTPVVVNPPAVFLTKASGYSQVLAIQDRFQQLSGPSIRSMEGAPNLKASVLDSAVPAECRIAVHVDNPTNVDIGRTTELMVSFANSIEPLRIPVYVLRE